MNIQDIMKALSGLGITTSAHFNAEKQQFYLDLQTEAKSHLHLYETGLLLGRYDYEKQMDLTKDVDALIDDLCYEFNYALHGRKFCAWEWAELCRNRGVKLDTWM